MEIIEVTLNWFRGELIGKTYLFEDDKSINKP